MQDVKFCLSVRTCSIATDGIGEAQIFTRSTLVLTAAGTRAIAVMFKGIDSVSGCLARAVASYFLDLGHFDFVPTPVE